MTPEEKRAYNKAYHEKNKEKDAARCKAYREKNREKVLAQEKAYSQQPYVKVARKLGVPISELKPAMKIRGIK